MMSAASFCSDAADVFFLFSLGVSHDRHQLEPSKFIAAGRWVLGDCICIHFCSISRIMVEEQHILRDLSSFLSG